MTIGMSKSWCGAVLAVLSCMVLAPGDARSEDIRVLSQPEIAAVCSKYRSARTTNLKLLEAVRGSFVVVVATVFDSSVADGRIQGRVIPRSAREHLLYVTGDAGNLAGVTDKIRSEKPVVIFGIVEEYMPDMENSCQITMKVLAAR